MNPIVRYYLHQAGRGYGGKDIVPIYSVPHFAQWGHGIGSVLAGFGAGLNQFFGAEPKL